MHYCVGNTVSSLSYKTNVRFSCCQIPCSSLFMMNPILCHMQFLFECIDQWPGCIATLFNFDEAIIREGILNQIDFSMWPRKFFCILTPSYSLCDM